MKANNIHKIFTPEFVGKPSAEINPIQMLKTRAMRCKMIPHNERPVLSVVEDESQDPSSSAVDTVGQNLHRGSSRPILDQQNRTRTLRHSVSSSVNNNRRKTSKKWYR
ncbi:hypothetical protein BV898_03791 [Hypsibius exemplaris]|uniref:Uncharacterized protein n=1 Tax=Hypsibius exemplaris TaxID=2072580 RepID=A0A1W0X4H7_HYPEX|nr:hypothetical protein BV898_03791 [Hypsibius exemplaris]